MIGRSRITPIVLALALATLSMALRPPSASAACPEPVTLTPETVVRGTTVTLTVSDDDPLVLPDEVTFDDDRIDVVNVGLVNDDVVITITVGQRSTAEAKTFTLVDDAGPDLECTLSVVPGDPTLLRVTPPSLVREASGQVALQGTNLDALDAISFGDDITVVADIPGNTEDPTSATAQLTVSATATSGARSVVGVVDDGPDAVLLGGFVVEPGPLTVMGIDPTSLTRGTTSTVTVSGTNLDTIENINMGNGVMVASQTLDDPTSLDLLVSVTQESQPVGTARDVVFTAGGTVVTLEDTLTVTAGLPEVSRIRPSRLRQGSTTEVTVEGLNLDGVTTVAAGEGLTIESIDALSPIKFLMAVTVAADAVLGSRDVTVEGALGTALVEEGLVVLERADPPVTLNFPDVIDVGRVEVGARKRASLIFINEVDVTESVLLEIVSGDVDEFRLFDVEGLTLSELYPIAVEIVLEPLQEKVVTIEFRPSLQTSSSATLQLTARGEEVGGIQVRGTGTAAQLSFSPTPPIAIPPVMEGEVGFRQVSTLSLSVEPTIIQSVEAVVEQDDSFFPEADELTTLTLSEPLPPQEEQLFGGTLITLETSYPAGTYEGEVWVRTSRSTAPIMPFTFSTTVTPAIVEAGDEPADPEPDAGADPRPDAGPDRRDTTPPPDATADPTEDASGGDAGTPPGDEGCCSQAPTGSMPWAGWWLVLALAALAVLRPSRRSTIDRRPH